MAVLLLSGGGEKNSARNQTGMVVPSFDLDQLPYHDYILLFLIKIQEELVKWQCCCYQEEVKIELRKNKLEWCPHVAFLYCLASLPTTSHILL
jgi:hypothetical protein